MLEAKVLEIAKVIQVAPPQRPMLPSSDSPCHLITCITAAGGSWGSGGGGDVDNFISPSPLSLS